MLANIPSVTFQGLIDAIRMLPRDISILVLGDHGIGKSSAVKLAAELDNEPCYDIRLAGKEPGDVIGVLDKSADGKTSKHLPPDWWRPMFDQDHKATLFLDELNRAHKDVRQGIFQLVLDRELNGNPLPKDVRLIVAGNDGDDYDVDELDLAFVTRFWVCRLEPEVSEWLSLDGTHSFVLKYITRYRDLLDSNRKDDLAPCRRGWSRLSHILTSNNITDSKHPMMMMWAAGCIGREQAVSFVEYVRSLQLITGEDIVDNYERVKEQLDINETGLVAKLNDEIIKILTERYPDRKSVEKLLGKGKKVTENRENILAYMLDQPIETFYSMFNLLATKNFADLVREFLRHTEKGEEFKSRISRSMGRKEDSK